MSIFQKLVVGFISLGVIILLVVSLSSNKTVITKGVTIGNDYTATTTESSWANVPHMIASSTNGIPNIQTLGSVVIGTTHASIVELRDATSSTDVSSTSIAVIAASPAIGSTLSFDIKITRGLMVNTATGFTGRYTITYR